MGIVKGSKKITGGKGQATALVISSSESPGAYDIVRSLARKGIRTAVASSNKHDIAFSSRFCAGALIIPELQKKNYTTILEKIETFAAQQQDQPVLYYVSDPELTFVQHFRERLSRRYRLLLPPDNVYEHVMNKAAFVSLAQQHHLPVPETYCATTLQELRSILMTIPLPCIVKPAYSEDWVWDTDEQREKFGPYKKALRRFTTRQQVVEFCRDLPFRAAGFLVQSYIEGRDENIVSFHGYFDESSRCLGYFLGRKIRTYPPHTGGSVYVETFYDGNLTRLSIGYLQRIQFRGIVKIDYKWDNRSQEYKILEINPRYNLWQLLGAYTGVNLAWIAYRSQRGEPVIDEQQPERESARLWYLKQDIRAFMDGYRKDSEWSLRSYLRSLRGNKYYRVFDPVDPVPFLVSLVQFILRNSARLVRLVFARKAENRQVHVGTQTRIELTVLHPLKQSTKEV